MALTYRDPRPQQTLVCRCKGPSMLRQQARRSAPPILSSRLLQCCVSASSHQDALQGTLARGGSLRRGDRQPHRRGDPPRRRRAPLRVPPQPVRCRRRRRRRPQPRPSPWPAAAPGGPGVPDHRIGLPGLVRPSRRPTGAGRRATRI